MSAPLIRILLATCNGGAHLAEQLDSYLTQTHDPWALWVSDDHSSDDTWTILERFRDAHPDREIRLMRGPGRGAAANFLSLITHPDLPAGPVALSDQDDVWLPNRLSRAWERVGDLEGPALYGSTTIETDPDLTPLKKQRKSLPPPSLANALVQNVVAGNTITLNAAGLAALRAGGAPDVAFHDWWIYLRMTGIGAQVVIDDTPLLYYRQHAGNVLGAHSGMRAGMQRVGALLRGTHAGWMRRNLDALLADEAALIPDHAQAARLLRDHPRRLQALRRSGASRSGRAGRIALTALALLGRV